MSDLVVTSPAAAAPDLLAKAEAYCRRAGVPATAGAHLDGVALIARCQSYLDQASVADSSVIRTVHHLACTGGTLISKAIQAQPNTQVLSEVDPFSTIPRDHQNRGFAPSDLILLARSGLFDLDPDTIGEMFYAALDVLHGNTQKRGQHLVLRDHSHSHFFTEVAPESRPSLLELLRGRKTTLSILTVRHPIDSWLSLKGNNWRHFEPYTLEEYARRYALFLDCYSDCEVIKYEDFVAAPNLAMERICSLLRLPQNDDWQKLLPAIRLTGDSGRKSNRIAPRARREISAEMIAEAAASDSYQAVCARLGYDAALTGDRNSQ